MATAAQATQHNSGFEVPGPYPTFIEAIGNGIVYLVTSEHTFETPIYKGALARAVNATDGTELWTISAATGEFAGRKLRNRRRILNILQQLRPHKSTA